MALNQKITTVLFDLDGTTMGHHRRPCKVWQQALIDEPDARRKLTQADIAGIMGMTSVQLMHKLFPHLSDQRGAELFDRLCMIENDYLRQHGGILYEGLEETLRALSKKFPLAIVSNCGVESSQNTRSLGHCLHD